MNTVPEFQRSPPSYFIWTFDGIIGAEDAAVVAPAAVAAVVRLEHFSVQLDYSIMLAASRWR